ncbi:MAG: nucleotidyltransferase domain-containing protein [Candidatus Saganbacteria bacterium]|nr:nucleotidyltransferase domain-containing protein [Candidatus Saganbacteria bacterium]
MGQNKTDKRLKDIVKRILAAGQPDKIVLYGSRARKENHSLSDFDIALFGKVPLGKIMDGLEESRTLLKLDIVLFDELKNKNLKKKILEEGVVLYERKA